MTRWILRLLPPAWREAIEGDLVEESRAIAPPLRPLWIACRAAAILAIFAAAAWAARLPPLGVARWPADALTDARFGLRRWRARPLFALAAVSTIALSTGAATALFSMVDGVLLKPLPYPQPERLVLVNRTYPDWSADPILSRSWDRISLAYPEFFYISEKSRTIDVLAVRTSPSFGLLPPDESGGARELRLDVVSASYFELFGARPVEGRFFENGDDRDDRRLVLISEALWRSRFGGRADVIGRTLPLADGARTIIGVVPAGFQPGRSRPDIWEPLSVLTIPMRADNNRNLDAYGRLRTGVSRREAEAEMDVLLRDHFRFPERTGGRVTSMAERQLAPVRTPLLVLLGGALMLLAMACANLAGFLVGDAASRVREVAVRSALGAGLGRLLRQLLVESSMLVAAGAALGLLAAGWGIRGLVAVAPSTVPRLGEVGLDGRAFGFAILAAAIAALLSGTVPALLLARAGSAAASGSTRVTAHRRTQARLLVAQLAVGITLLAGAALFVRTLHNLTAMDAGFNRANLLTARVTLPAPLYTKPDQYRQYFERAEAAVAALPGVEAAAVSSGLAFATGRASTTITLENSTQVEAQRRFVSPSFFAASGVPLITGRGFSSADPLGGDIFVVVSREMAARFWSGDPIGRRFSQGTTQFVVIGVVGDVRDLSLALKPSSTFYVSTRQRPPWPTMRVMARTRVPPASLAAALRTVLSDIDPAVPIEDITTMDELVAVSLEDQRFRAALFVLLAVVAAALAAVGLYGALARAVTERRREIGVRLALGARSAQVTRMFLLEASKVSAIGGALGLLGAFVTARVTATLLFGIGRFDPATLAVVVVSAAALAVGGGYFPARRASRVDPMTALRND